MISQSNALAAMLGLAIVTIFVGAFIIAARERARRANGESRRRGDGGSAAAIEALFEGSNLPVQVLRPCGRRVFANRACAELFGYDSSEELLALPPHAVVSPEHLDQVRLAARTFFESGGTATTHECRCLRKDGGHLWVETRQQRIAWDGEPALLTIFVDITQRKEAEEAVRQSDSSFRNLIETSNLAVQIIGLDGTRLFANVAAARMFGYGSVDELIALPPFALVAPECRSAAEQAQRSFIDKRSAGLHYDYDGLRKNGSRFRVQAYQQMARWNGVDAIFMVRLDVTERNRAEQIVRESEERLKNAQRIANFGNWEIALGADKLTISDQGLRILGLDVEDGHPDTGAIVAMFHPDDLEHVRNARAEAIRTDTPYSVEYRLVRPDGDIRHLRERGEVTRDDSGRAVKLSGVVQDVTDLHKAQSALAERESFYKELIELLPESVYVHSENRIVMANSMTARQFRAESVDGIIGLDPDDLLFPEDVPAVRRRRVLHTGKGTAWPYSRLRYRRLDGSFYDGEGTSAAITWQGRPARLVVTRDVTERLVAERALKESEERLKDAQRIARVGHWYHSIATGQTSWSEEMYRIYGVSMAEGPRTRKAFVAMVHPDDRDRLLDDIARIVETEGTATTEYRIVRPDGDIRHVRTIRELLPGPNGKPDRLRGVTQDITEQKKAEEALRLSEEAFRDLIDGSVLGILIRSMTGGRLYLNRAFRELFGFTSADEMLNAPEVAFAAPHEHQRVRSYVLARRRGEAAPMEYDLDCVRRDGAVFPAHIYMREIAWMGQRALQMTVVDLTELKRAEHEVQKLNEELEARVEQRTAELHEAQSELVKRERLATLGQLTATVSHELRNPLGAMRSSMYVVRKRVGDLDEQLAATLERIDRNITRCDAIIDELLDFTRIRDLHCAEVCLDAWLGELLDEQFIPDGIRIERAFTMPGARVRIDPDRIRRAFVNTLENAVQVMSENGVVSDSGPRRLRIATRAADCRVKISISDTGPGIAPDVLPQVFEPLYSTKSFGIGLGLPVVKQIMEQHDGGVEIDTEPGQGTTVTLWMPQDG